MKFWSRFILVMLLAAAILVTGVSLARRPADQRIQGAHKLKIDGDLIGAGTAVVQAQSITFSLKLQDEKGAPCNGDSEEIDFGDGRFFGTLQLGGTTVEISGRVDLPKEGKKPRVTAFIRTSDGRVARIANSFKTADAENPPTGDDDPSTHPSEDHSDDRRDRRPHRH